MKNLRKTSKPWKLKLEHLLEIFKRVFKASRQSFWLLFNVEKLTKLITKLYPQGFLKALWHISQKLPNKNSKDKRKQTKKIIFTQLRKLTFQRKKKLKKIRWKLCMKIERGLAKKLSIIFSFIFFAECFSTKYPFISVTSVAKDNSSTFSLDLMLH